MENVQNGYLSTGFRDKISRGAEKIGTNSRPSAPLAAIICCYCIDRLPSRTA